MIELCKLKKTKEEMLEKAYELGLTYENKFGGCAPGCLLACMETMGIVNEDLYKASTGFSGGLGVTSESQCGALSGGVMFLGILFGRGFTCRFIFDQPPSCNQYHQYTYNNNNHKKFNTHGRISS